MRSSGKLIVLTAPLFAFLIPSIFTPLHDTRMEKEEGVTQTRQLTALQWQLMMKC
jgi:hypothetical protein